MAVFAVRIIKRDTYFGESREFGNTYHYRTIPGQVFEDQRVAEYLRDQEQPLLQDSVAFDRWETYGPTDGPAAANVIRDGGSLAGSGQATSISGMYKELCVLVTWEISRAPVTNRRRWLRKFFRMPGFPAGIVTDPMIQGEEPLPDSSRQAYIDYGNSVARVPGPGADPYELANEQGDGEAPVDGAMARPFLFTRDIGLSIDYNKQVL